MLITKADGTKEEFKPEKLVGSLKRAGASEVVAESITGDIEKELQSGVSTEEIYSHAFTKLRDTKHDIAARYSLKRAVLDFGPSGFPFEDYVAELFRAEGKQVSVRQVVKGTCVEHEIDVVIEDTNPKCFVEAKFHNSAGFKTDLKIALYVQARVADIGSGCGLIVTNTKFTEQAKKYATCKNLELLAWDYPQGATLHERIDRAQLYPVTALTSLSKKEKTALLSQQMVLCNELPKRADMLRSVGVSGKKADQVLEEVGALCVPGKAV